MDILWPRPNAVALNENNNSVVLTLTLGGTAFVLTGDAEGDVWTQIAGSVPAATTFFKVPHHGATNGTFDSLGGTPWINALPPLAKVGISSHIQPFQHPSSQVVQVLRQNSIDAYRTDEHYHVTFETDGSSTSVRFSHI